MGGIPEPTGRGPSTRGSWSGTAAVEASRVGVQIGVSRGREVVHPLRAIPGVGRMVAGGMLGAVAGLSGLAARAVERVLAGLGMRRGSRDVPPPCPELLDEDDLGPVRVILGGTTLTPRGQETVPASAGGQPDGWEHLEDAPGVSGFGPAEEVLGPRRTHGGGRRGAASSVPWHRAIGSAIRAPIRLRPASRCAITTCRSAGSPSDARGLAEDRGQDADSSRMARSPGPE
jgi:hypothetical protein